MDLITCAQEKDSLKKFLMTLIISKSMEKDSFFDIDQVKSFDNISVSFLPVTNISYREFRYDGVKITFSKLFRRGSGLTDKKLVFYFPFTDMKSMNKRADIHLLMSSLGCLGLKNDYPAIRDTLKDLAKGKKLASANLSRPVHVNIVTPMFRDMANGRLVYKSGMILCG